MTAASLVGTWALARGTLTASDGTVRPTPLIMELPPYRLPALRSLAQVQQMQGDLTSAATGLEQTPVVGLQVPATWQASDAVQTTAAPGTQVPAWQVSFWVQRLPSLHAAPSAFAGFEQIPVVGLHVPASWH